MKKNYKREYYNLDYTKDKALLSVCCEHHFNTMEFEYEIPVEVMSE